jgi:hypothetical protein
MTKVQFPMTNGFPLRWSLDIGHSAFVFTL